MLITGTLILAFGILSMIQGMRVNGAFETWDGNNAISRGSVMVVASLGMLHYALFASGASAAAVSVSAMMVLASCAMAGGLVGRFNQKRFIRIRIGGPEVAAEYRADWGFSMDSGAGMAPQLAR